jgi:hypothetical protein
MATKQFYATRDFKYGTRMMRAGDPVEMTAPHARLYTALGAISPTKPKAAKVETPIVGESPIETAARAIREAPTKAKRAPRKAAKKTAK